MKKQTIKHSADMEARRKHLEKRLLKIESELSRLRKEYMGLIKRSGVKRVS